MSGRDAGVVPIIADTRRYVVIDKPSGLLSAPGKDLAQPDCARARVQQMYAEASGPMTVHRLDMDTSGLLLVALDAEAHRALSMMLERRRARKAYIAILDGHIGPDEGEIDLPLAKDWENRPLMRVDEQLGRPSKTRFRVLERGTGFGGTGFQPVDPARPTTRIEFTPVTGRSHQLRVHAAHPRGLGAPILGDRLYGDPTLAPRLLLHASGLEFTDPLSGREVAYESPAPF